MITKALLAALLLAGCASIQEHVAPPAFFPDPAWWAAATRSGGTFMGDDGTLRRISAAQAKNLLAAGRAIQAQSGLSVDLELEDSNDPDAYATEAGGRRQVVLTLGFLDALGDDRDALATTIGHEVAHLYYGHGVRRRALGRYVIGDANAIAGINAVDTSLSRYEEREADLKGMAWAAAAGYSPCGSARTMRALQAYGNSRGDPFLATHPGGRERIARADTIARKLTGKGC